MHGLRHLSGLNGTHHHSDVTRLVLPVTKLFLLFQNELIRIYFHWTYWLFFRWSAVKYIFYLTDATVVNYFRRLFSYLRIYTRWGRVEVCVREDRCVCLCVYVYCFVSSGRMSNLWLGLFWGKFSPPLAPLEVSVFKFQMVLIVGFDIRSWGVHFLVCSLFHFHSHGCLGVCAD